MAEAAGVRRIIRTLRVAAPIWFIAVVIVQGIMQPGYSHVAMPISALAASPAGWLQNLNFYVTGVLLTASAKWPSRRRDPLRHTSQDHDQDVGRHDPPRERG